MQLKQLLQSARDLIADHWTQHAIARDAEGYPVWEHSPAAVSWCAVGACYKVVSEEEAGKAGKAVNLLSETAHSLFGMPIVSVNNDLGLVPTLSVFDHAISKL